MNKSTVTINIFFKNYVKKLSKYTINLYLKIVKMMTRTWQIMKEITGKCKVNSNRFPKSINVKGKSIKKNNRIAEEFNKYFTNVEPNLASKIQNTSKIFEDFLFPVQKNMEHKDLSFEEFEKTQSGQ